MLMDLSAWLPPELDISPENTFCTQGNGASARADELVEGLLQFRLSFQWVHKRGRVKPVQYWAYCEGYQANYVCVQLAVPGFTWSAGSRLFAHKRNDACLVLAEDVNVLSHVVRGVFIDRELGAGHGISSEFAREDLEEVDPSEVLLKVALKEDTTVPVHPQQGTASSVNVQQQSLNGQEDGEKVKTATPPPFSQTMKFRFSKRTSGWFVLHGSLYCRGMLLATGTSDAFMLYDPRIRNRSQLQEFSVKEIKYMQAFALTPTPDETSWLQLGLCLGCDINRVSQLLTLAKEGTFFKPLSEKKTVQKALKRKAQSAPAMGAPNTKRRRGPGGNELSFPRASSLAGLLSTSPSLSKPILYPHQQQPQQHQHQQQHQMPSNGHPRSPGGATELLQHLQALAGQRWGQAPHSPLGSQAPLRNATVSSAAAPLSSSQEPLLFQWMTHMGTGLQRPCFVSVYVNRCTTLEEFHRKILLKRASSDTKIAHIYCLRGSTVTEILDTMDLQSLLGGDLGHNGPSEPPKVLVAPNNSRPPLARLFDPTAAEDDGEFLEQALPSPSSPNSHPIPFSSFPSAGVEASFAREVPFTVSNGEHGIREVYSVPLLAPLLESVAKEFGRSVSELSHLKKATTGARLTSDKNVIHVSPVDILEIVWESTGENSHSVA